MRKPTTMLALAGIALCAPAHALQLFSFESGLEGFYNPNWSVGDVSLTQSGTGATSGSSALKIVRPGTSNGFRWILADGVSSAIKSDMMMATRAYMDVTVGTDFGASNWLKIGFMYQQTNGWQQTTEQTLTVGPGTQTLEFDITALTTGSNATDWARIGFSINSDGPAATTLYIDNIRTNAVPEPGTLLALGAGIAAIAARRRRSR